MGVAFAGFVEGDAHFGQEAVEAFAPCVGPDVQARGEVVAVQHGFVEGPVAGEEEAGLGRETDGCVGWGARGSWDGVVGAREGDLGRW